MALLGKLLLFFNFFAAVGLISLASVDWAQRQEVNATALQYYLALGGLPVEAQVSLDADPEDVPFAVPTTGGYTTDTVRESLVKAYLKGADGGERLGAAGDKPAFTQLREVSRVQDKLGALVTAAPPAGRLELLCGKFTGTQFTPGLLIRLAESFEEREIVRQLASAKPQDVVKAVERAEAILKRKFDAVQARPNPALAATFAEQLKTAAERLRAAAVPRQEAENRLIAAQAGKDPEAIKAATELVKRVQTDLDAAWKKFGDVLAGDTPAAARNDADRRRRIAHLLTFLDRSADWQGRVVKVVGLKVYQHAIADQTGRLQDMARSVQRQIESDQASFVDRYEQLKNLAIERAELAAAQESIRKSLADQATKDNEAVTRRAAELKLQQDALAAVKTDVNARLAAQAEVEAQLFDVQKQVGDTLRKNFELEGTLDAAEKSIADKTKPKN